MTDFMKYFEDFKKYAFRLELLQKYDVGEEKESFEHFMKTGKVIDDGSTEEWMSLVRKVVQRNAVIQRVHIIVLPLTNYMKYELECYKTNIEAGEKIYFLLKNDYDKIKDRINYDFWLFDDEVVLKMNYDSEGKFLGFDKIKKDISKYIKIKDGLLSMASPIKEFKK